MSTLKFTTIVLIIYFLYFSINILIDLSKKQKSANSPSALKFEDIEDERDLHEAVDASHLMDNLRNNPVFHKPIEENHPSEENEIVTVPEEQHQEGNNHEVHKDVEEVQGFTI